MSTANLLDEKHIINAIVRVGGERVSFVYLNLVQEYGQHHRFEIGLDYDITGQAFMDDPTQQIELIGRLAIIDIQHGNDNAGAYVFRGVITEVCRTGREGKHGNLVLKGASPTIMLERGKRMDIYSDMTLGAIFKKLIDGVYSDYMKFVDEPTYENKVDFLMQYNESDWEFLQRMAYLYGENLFYSGSEILFGAYKEWEAVKLTYDREITDVVFSSRMLPNESVSFQYVAEQDMMLERQSPDSIENSNSWLDKTAKQNRALTSGKPAKRLSGVAVGNRSQMDELVKRDKARTAAQTVFVTGKAKSYEPYIGRLITICMPEGMSAKKELGTYRVIKSVHRIDEGNRYTNEFEAVPASLQTMPVAEPRMPVVSSILAKVTSNDDPMGLGRVLVDFPFSNQYNQVWMRVMSPDAGSSESVGVNRGMVFIPEKGDQVMVGFEHNDSGRPYVMGSMFHGKNGAGGGGNNATKSIITRSGVKIVFNDDLKSLHIEDPSGNTWDMDGKGNIAVNAPKKIILNTNDFDINIQNDFKINVGNKLSFDVVNQFITNTRIFKQNVIDFMHLESGKALINSHENIKIESPELYTIGQDKLFIHSDQSVIVNSMGNTEIKGKQGSNFTNASEDYALSNEINAKVIVTFIPKDNWEGEFGFDWMRIGKGSSLGQTNTSKDADYNTIMGHYLNNTTTNPFVPDMDADGDGVKDMYAELKKEYTPIQMIHKVDAVNKPLPYYIPILRIYRHPNDFRASSSANLRLQIEVMEEPDKLVLEYDSKYFHISEPIGVMPIGIISGTPSIMPTALPIGSQISPTVTSAATPISAAPIATPKAVTLGQGIKHFKIRKKTLSTALSPHTLDITIDCIDNLPSAKEIKAIFIKYDVNTGEPIQSLAGIMRVMPNAKANRKVKKIVFVNVVTDIDNDNIKEKGFDSFSADDQKYLMRKGLRQALVDPIISQVESDMSITGQRATFNSRYVFGGSSIKCYDERPNSGFTGVDVYLRSKLPAIYRNSNHICIFYFNFPLYRIKSDGTGGNINGYSSGKNIVMGTLADSGTPAHEVFHALKLKHIFEHKSQTKNGRTYPEAKHCFQEGKTKNLMDYTNLNGNDRHFIYNWQAVIVNAAADTEPLNYTPQ